ncbi:MAG: insulinase family protein [Bacteroidaceae bacterium]|nr:insulinase family protein [Bacteroidaceae bacterium]
MENYHIQTLDNGLRVIHLPSPTNVAYCGIAIDAGSRDERDSEHGIAHFCEHLLFKGTHKRKAWHIINRMDSVGGDLNAYTNKEETVIYAAFTKEHFSRAVELIADIVFQSAFPQHEIDKEVEVIAEEIESYNDSPSELIFDQFENLIYENHPLGHDILGKADRVRQFTTADALSFIRRYYRPENMVFFVFGHLPFSRVVSTVEKYCGSVPQWSLDGLLCDTDTHGSVFGGDKWRQPLQAYQPVKKRDSRATHQAHVMMGGRSYPSSDERRIAMYFLNNIIAGPSMNTMLNIALREHNGLVYTVESSLTNYTDTGTFGLYFGCDNKDVERCMDIIRKEFDKLISTPLTQRQMQAALKQMKGQILVACDNFESYALDMAKSFLHYNIFEGIDDTLSQLSALTPELVQQTAKEMLADESLSALVYE